jgi:hypothetical protein
MRPRSRFLAGVWVVLLLPALTARASAQLHCNPPGDHFCTPGDTQHITTSLDPISMAWVDNYVIWVNGVGHSGQTYDLPTDPNLNPKEYFYYATATIHYWGGGSRQISSIERDGRRGDLIAINAGKLDTVLYDNDCALYQRNYVSGDNLGRDVPRPQFKVGDPPDGYSFPVCYVRGSPVTVKFHTTGTGASNNNGVVLQYWVYGTLVNPSTGQAESVPDWPFQTPFTAYTAGTDTTFTTPNLPPFIFFHQLKLWFNLEVQFQEDLMWFLTDNPDGNPPTWTGSFALHESDPVFNMWYGGDWPVILSSKFPPPPHP